MAFFAPKASLGPSDEYLLSLLTHRIVPINRDSDQMGRYFKVLYKELIGDLSLVRHTNNIKDYAFTGWVSWFKKVKPTLEVDLTGYFLVVSTFPVGSTLSESI